MAQAELSDGDFILLGKKDSNEFISLAFTTTEYGAQEITNAAFEALEK